MQGEPLDYDDEMREFVIEAYRIDPVTGRRVYDEGVLSRPKGRAKSEIAGHIGVAEAFGPVRFDGWDADGQPVGRPGPARCPAELRPDGRDPPVHRE